MTRFCFFSGDTMGGHISVRMFTGWLGDGGKEQCAIVQKMWAKPSMHARSLVAGWLHAYEMQIA